LCNVGGGNAFERQTKRNTLINNADETLVIGMCQGRRNYGNGLGRAIALV
jgi:hypothetical protein